jgi:tricorn protease
MLPSPSVRKGFWPSAVVVILMAIMSAAMIARPAAAAEQRPLMRFPDIHGSTVVFCYGEDIWSAPVDGGVATRLTIHDGEESFPKFSPDGSLIAFTGEYDGNADVYVMNLYGGGITRVTFHPGYDRVVGWHPTENKIIFNSTRNSFNRFSRLFLISPDGTGLEELIMHEAAQGSFSPDGKKIAYNRISRENRTWKRYKGGTAQNVYMFDFEKNEDRLLTTFEGTDRIPMWIGDKIYFSSDRERVLNIYSIDPATGDIEQLTKHTEYDVRRPSMGDGKIVYELGGSLWMLDVATKNTSRVEVAIKTDAPEMRSYITNVKDLITQFDCSPGGERALVTARGEIFTVPKEHGPTRNLTRDCGSRDKDAAWSPDGKWIAYISDKRGEYEIYITDPKGENEPIRLTSNKDGYRHTLRWSPDGKKLAFADQTLRCFYIDIDTKKITEVDRAKYENIDVALDLKPIHDFAWSPDSRYIAYSKMGADLVYNVYIYSLDDGKSRNVSEGIFNDFGPAFSADGEHLFFISNRRFNPTLCDFEWELVYKKVAGIYALTLRKEGEPILPFRSDEVEVSGNEGSTKKEEKKDDESVRVEIDFDGLARRIQHLPLPRGNYRSLSANDKDLYYLNKDEGDFNRFEFRRIGPMDLHRFCFKDREEKTVIKGINGYKLSADGSKIVYRKRDGIGIIEASATDSKGEALDLSDLEMKIVPIEEWTQIFNEAWRMERDFYYEPNMHGLDWNAMKEKYGRLLPFVSCRQDIRYIVGELIGELNTSHTYVFGGDYRRDADRVNVGLLGTDWEIDEKAGRYRFGKIYRVTDWSREIIPPLTLPGINIEEGYYLLAVNGEEVTTDRNIYSYFQGLAGEQVKLVVGTKPSMKEAREVTVSPVGSEYLIKYQNWVELNRKIVDEKSNGQIGYVHLPDTYLGSATEFPKYFYAQLRKKGIIVDGRFNGGGLDPDIFLRRLDKEILAYWTRRYSHDQTNPGMATRAHMVCITNRQAGSGGDMLPMEFQMKNMGPVIGTRTWGGLVGVSMWLGLIDGGGLSAPDYRIYDSAGKWIVENEGVQPDIVVDLDPVEVSRGYDAQLMKAIEVLMKEIERDPLPWPEHEPFRIDR